MGIYDAGLEATTIDGTVQPLEDYSGQVLLIVNVASECGFTPQYAGLESLYRKYKDRGFTVLGFPSNQFGQQEPGAETEIKAFCERNYGVTFPMFAKIDVNGDDAHPIYRYLKSSAKGVLGTESIKWNFTKFLVARDGTVLDRFASRDTPEDIERHVLAALAAEPVAQPRR